MKDKKKENDVLGRNPLDDSMDSLWKMPKQKEEEKEEGKGEEKEEPEEKEAEAKEEPEEEAKPPSDEEEKKEETGTSTRKPGEPIQLIGFYLDESLFGINIAKIREIIKLREITPLPESPHYVKGVLNLRGKVIPVFSLRGKIGFQEKEDTTQGRIIIIDNPMGNYGVIVDSVTEVLRIEDDVIDSAPDLISGVSAEYISGVVRLEEKLLIFLDIDRVIDRERDF